MRNITIKSLFLGILLPLFFSCENDPYVEPKVDQAILFYMLADGSLSSYFNKNIESAARGFNGEGRVLIFRDDNGGHSKPTLSELKLVEGRYEAVMLEEMPDLDDKTTDPEVMHGIIKHITQKYAADRYGLVLSSHGKGWVPNTSTKSRSFGPDPSESLNVDQMDEAIPAGVFDYILFDACHMASAEIAYELRNTTEYLLGSTTEVWAAGLPYNMLINDLMNGHLEKVCDHYGNYYNGVNAGKTGTFSLIDLREMETLHRMLVENLPSTPPQSLSRLSEVQEFGRRVVDLKNAFYDIQDYCSQVMPLESARVIEEQVKRCVPYMVTTKVFDPSLSLERNHGLSFYVPNEAWSECNHYYQGIRWSEGLPWEY